MALNFEDSYSNDFSVQKQSMFTMRERGIYVLLVGFAIVLLLRYIFWWFTPIHIPTNWYNLPLHLLDIVIFGILSFVVFIGYLLRIGNWFAIWYGAKAQYIKPKEGLKVAFITSFVPAKEPIDMLAGTLRAMKEVTYPHDTWVLDEGNDLNVKNLAKSLGVKYFTRYGIKKYNQETGLYRAKTKAGNHNAWRDLYDKDYDIVAQIDMDHVPCKEYFERTLGYFQDKSVGFVGMPQVYENTNNWMARGAAEQAYFFHGVLQKGFYGSDMPFLIGTSHIYRALAMNEIGGYAPTIVEDHLTGMKFYASKWKGVFVPEILATGEGPQNWLDYFNQQMRWSYGLFEIFFRHTPRLLLKLSWKKKINYFFAQLFYFSGVAVFLGSILTILYLAYGVNSANMNLREWITYAFPPFVAAYILQVWMHRFSINPKNEPVFGFLGMFLGIAANLVYTVAFFKFIAGKKLRYMVTQKGTEGEKQRVPLKVFKFHIAVAYIMVLAVIYSFIKGHSAIQLRVWGLFNIATLLAIVGSAYWTEVYNKLLEYKHTHRYIWHTYRLAFTSIVVIILLFLYSQRFTFVQAIFNKRAVIDNNTSIDNATSGRINPPSKGAFLGISLYQHNDTDALRAIQNELGKKFAIVGYYQSWGISDNRFDKTWAENISRNGSVPLITWEPWRPVSGFDRSQDSVDQKEYRLKNIIDGQFDSYIREYALDIRSYKKPVMIRFAHEMNGNWYPWAGVFNTPEEYILAWRHVHEIFDELGTANVTWVWAPNEVYTEKTVPFADQISAFYPGDDYVDWVGFSAFNWAGSYKQNSWKTPESLYAHTVEDLKKFNKPILIAETASADVLQNPTQKAQWIQQLAIYLEHNSIIKGIVWFNTIDNGVDWTLISSEDAKNSFRDFFQDYFIETIAN